MLQLISVRERTKTRPDVVWSRNLAPQQFLGKRRMELTKAIADKEVRIWKTPRQPRRVRKWLEREREREREGSPGNIGEGIEPKGRAGGRAVDAG
ncbi:hypothetical protein M5K25_003701 [Dendrobium thyrsiflorum]|uniref:Uncharacterized protein n=1 Tax=Dendrobium thyrsiflorum TaxID=117978 RepID=A0ABD0VRR7_DENTH